MQKSDISILLVDDEPDILEIVGYNLANEGYKVIKAENGREGISLAKKEKPQLIILDVMMPGMDGIETCEQIRSQPDLKDTIVVFLTSRGEDYSQMAGFNAGADDYITKPIKPKVLLSKIKALLQRFGSTVTAEENLIHLRSLIINREEYKVTKNGKEIFLPRKEFELLYLLASHPGKVFTREQIMERVWGNDTVVGGRTVDVHIRKLRGKIGDNSFQTIKGIGYKFIE